MKDYQNHSKGRKERDKRKNKRKKIKEERREEMREEDGIINMITKLLIPSC